MKKKEFHEIAERLRFAREEMNLNQAEVAKALNRSQSFVSRCESGDRRIDIFELEAFVRLYQKPLDYFLTGK